MIVVILFGGVFWLIFYQQNNSAADAIKAELASPYHAVTWKYFGTKSDVLSAVNNKKLQQYFAPLSVEGLAVGRPNVFYNSSVPTAPVAPVTPAVQP